VRLKKLTNKDIIRVETHSGVLELSVLERGQVLVDMGAPILEPADIPFTADRQRSVYTLEAAGQTVELGAVSMGNPHAVILTDDVDGAAIEQLGQAVQQHPGFPRQANVGFMQVQDRSHVRLRVYERGVGETLACGSGACAAVVSGILRDQLDHEVSVELRGGTLKIRWDGDGAHVLMTGPASIVFEGQIRL
jgi:diaminopimelate epimerase